MLTSMDIIHAVAEITETRVHAILGQRRLRKYIVPRHIAYYLIRKYTTRSLPSIGLTFDRDHTTILHGMRAHERRIKEDPEWWADLEPVIIQAAYAEREYRWSIQRERAVSLGVKLVDNADGGAYVEPTAPGV